MADEAWELFKNENWSELKNLFTNNNLNNWNGINWPPNNGAKNLIKVEKGNELTNKVFDRFQTGNNSHVLGGRYASPAPLRKVS